MKVTRRRGKSCASASGFSAILETEHGYLAAGIDSREMVWFSDKGHTWTKRGGFNENNGYAYDRINDMAAIGDQLVAIGVRWPHPFPGPSHSPARLCLRVDRSCEASLIAILRSAGLAEGGVRFLPGYPVGRGAARRAGWPDGRGR